MQRLHTLFSHLKDTDDLQLLMASKPVTFASQHEHYNYNVRPPGQQNHCYTRSVLANLRHPPFGDTQKQFALQLVIDLCK